MARGGLLTVLASGYSQEANALFAQMTVQPSGARKKLINDLIVGVKTSGAWSLMDVLYITAAHDSQAARLNWKSPGNFTLAAVGGGAAFTVDKGFKGDGVGTAWDTGYNPVTAPGSLFVQNSSHMGVVVTENVTSDVRCVGHGRNMWRPRSSTSGMQVNCQNASSDQLASNNLDAMGNYTCYRNNAADFRGFKNGAFVSAPVRASSAILSTTWYICGSNDTPTFSVTQVGAFYAGGALTDQIVADLNTAIQAYMTAIGAL